MKISAIILLCWFGLAATVAAQGTTSSKPDLKTVRTALHELEARNEKLQELMTQYRSLIEQRPTSEGGKQAYADQLAKWNAALERLMHRIDDARAAVAETEQRLDPKATGSLPVGLAKEVAAAHNEAEAQRTAAEHALAKTKPAPARTSKHAKDAPPAKPAPPIPDDL